MRNKYLDKLKLKLSTLSESREYKEGGDPYDASPYDAMYDPAHGSSPFDYPPYDNDDVSKVPSRFDSTKGIVAPKPSPGDDEVVSHKVANYPDGSYAVTTTYKNGRIGLKHAKDQQELKVLLGL